MLNTCAQELGLKLKGKAAYGEYKNFLITLSENTEVKLLSINAQTVNQYLIDTLNSTLTEKEFKKAHKIVNLHITDTLIHIALSKKVTSSTISQLLDFVIDKIVESGVPTTKICTSCGQEIIGDVGKKVMIADTAFYMHDGCISTLDREIEENKELAKREGSVATGTIGAILGALIGSIPWAIAYYFGWMVGWLGLLIGFTTKKGYELFKGKETKAKAIVVILVVLATVVFVEYATVFVSGFFICKEELNLQNIPYTTSELVQFVKEYVMSDSEVSGMIIRDILIGLLFAGIGIYSTVKEIFTGTNHSKYKPVILDD